MTARPRLSAQAIVGLGLVGLTVIMALVSFFWTPFDPTFTDPNAPKVPPLTGGHLLGTDQVGRDIFSLLMVGARTALYVGIVAVGIGALVGTPIGVAGAMMPRRYSSILLRGTDIMLAFPALLLALTLAAVWRGGVTTSMVAIGIAAIPSFVRVVRSAALVVMAQEYIRAARVAGRSRWAIAIEHVLPNTLGVVIVQSSVAYALAILAEAGLSYLGFGAGLTRPSWGLMLQQSQALLGTDPLIALWPALAIAGTVIGFNLLGDGLRDRYDPRLAERGTW